MKTRTFLYWLLVALLTATMLISGTIVARYVMDSLRQKQDYDELAAQVERSRVEAALAAQTESSPTEGTQESVPVISDDPQQGPAAVPTEPSILPEYAGLYEDNSDLVGWMTIEGTPVNYPVMQSPDRVDYYLKRNFKREHNSHGSLYVRESCDVFAPSDNLTIYGHHMKDGSMFAGLDNYLKKDFYKKYPSIRFDTIYERHTYTIFAVFTTTASLGEGFSYHLFEDAADEAEFDDFVATCKSLSVYDTQITPRYGDKLICLSTCEYTHDNGRLVVAAVRDEPAIH